MYGLAQIRGLEPVKANSGSGKGHPGKLVSSLMIALT